jgi:hypothetical protein
MNTQKTGAPMGMLWRRGFWISLVISMLALSACRMAQPAAQRTAVPVTPTAVNVTTSTPVATVTATVQPSPVPSAVLTATATVTVSPTAVSTAPAQASILDGAIPPVRDNRRLAEAYRGLVVGVLPTPPAAITEPLALGTVETFQVNDVVNNRVEPIEARLWGMSDHAYFWFQAPPDGIEPDLETLDQVAQAFDTIYEVVRAQFGEEANPGLDGDPRLHVLHASPTALCGLADPNGGCGLAGMVDATDLEPAALDPKSNEREMFVMNDRQFGTDYYLGVLAHEFRHMIEFNYEQAGTDWEKEGSAVLAAELVGLPSGGLERGNLFLKDPDQQLTNWAETGTSAYYGQGYLFNQYLFNRLGPVVYREFATSALPGFAAIEAVIEANGLEGSAESLWLDWLVALAVHDVPGAPDIYRYEKEGLETAVNVPLERGPGQLIEQVHQYAADYYELPEGESRVLFTGDTEVPLLVGWPAGEERFWYGQRANYSNPRLTRALDLREVASATLLYDVYVDLERGYDFAYVAVSEDNGRSWTPLVSAGMQGLDEIDNPAGSALAERFYTGRVQQWQRETIDLSPFAGSEVLLRFEAVTDPILTYSGLAIDNIAEVGFADDGTMMDEGWEAEGFSLVAAGQPQRWHLQLITFADGGVQVRPIAVDEAGQSMIAVNSVVGERPPLLVVAATAPMTLEPAHYRLQVEP